MISSILINAVVFWLVGTQLRKVKALDGALAQILRGTLLFSLAWLVLTSIAYLCSPLYFDHGESALSSIAAHWLRGGEMYPSFTAADRYTMLYGPWPILMAASTLALGSATFFLAKLPGALSLAGSLAGFYFLLTRLRLHRRERFLLLGVLSVTLLGFRGMSYFVRPDSYMLLNMILAMLAVQYVPNRFLVYMAVGFFGALSFNCKIHGPFYFIPVAIFYLEQGKNRWTFLGLLASIAAFVFGVVFPFLLPRISGFEFYNWINLPWVSSGQSFPIGAAIKGITYGVAFFAPLWMMGLRQRYPLTFYTLAFVSLVIGIVSGTPGSSTYMYLPLLPFYVWLGADLYSHMDVAWRKRMAVIIGALLFAFALSAINKQKSVVASLAQAPQRWVEFNDLKNLASQVQGPVELGYGSTDQYESSFYKPWLVHHGYGYFLDACALMKITYSGVPIPPATLEKIKNCEVPHMILPKGGKYWSLDNFYTGQRLFSEEMRTLLLARYTLKNSSQYYDLLECQK